MEKMLYSVEEWDATMTYFKINENQVKILKWLKDLESIKDFKKIEEIQPFMDIIEVETPVSTSANKRNIRVMEEDGSEYYFSVDEDQYIFLKEMLRQYIFYLIEEVDQKTFIQEKGKMDKRIKEAKTFCSIKSLEGESYVLEVNYSQYKFLKLLEKNLILDEVKSYSNLIPVKIEEGKKFFKAVDNTNYQTYYFKLNDSQAKILSYLEGILIFESIEEIEKKYIILIP